MKSFFKFIHKNRFLSIIALLLLGYDILTGYKPIEIFLGYGPGIPIGGTESAKSIAEGVRTYRIMFWGLFLSLIDNIIHIPKLSSWLDK